MPLWWGELSIHILELGGIFLENQYVLKNWMLNWWYLIVCFKMPKLTSTIILTSLKKRPNILPKLVGTSRTTNSWIEPLLELTIINVDKKNAYLKESNTVFDACFVYMSWMDESLVQQYSSSFTQSGLGSLRFECLRNEVVQASNLSSSIFQSPWISMNKKSQKCMMHQMFVLDVFYTISLKGKMGHHHIYIYIYIE